MRSSGWDLRLGLRLESPGSCWPRQPPLLSWVPHPLHFPQCWVLCHPQMHLLPSQAGFLRQTATPWAPWAGHGALCTGPISPGLGGRPRDRWALCTPISRRQFESSLQTEVGIASFIGLIVWPDRLSIRLIEPLIAYWSRPAQALQALITLGLQKLLPKSSFWGTTLPNEQILPYWNNQTLEGRFASAVSHDAYPFHRGDARGSEKEGAGQRQQVSCWQTQDSVLLVYPRKLKLTQ